MSAFVSQLASLCREHVTRNKWVFVPSHAIGRTLGERIALDGTNWLNLRFVTPLDVALRMGAPFLVERGIDPSEDGLGPALVMRLLLELPASALAGSGAAGLSGYFRPLAVQPTMAQALWTTVRELRMAGVRAEDLNPHGRNGPNGGRAGASDGRRAGSSDPAGPAPSHTAFESRAKHAELHALLAAYERFLETNRRGDMAVVYEEAVKHPDWCPIQPEDCWTEMPDVIWAPLQRQLIDAMPGERIVARAMELPGVVVPRRLDGRVERLGADRNRNPLAFLLAPGESVRAAGRDGAEAARAGRRERGAPVGAQATPVTSALRRAPNGAVRGQDPQTEAGGPAGLHLFHAGGREAEIEEVFRRILASGAPLDQVEIACASSQYATLLWEKACRHGWPVTIATGIPAPLTRPGRALLAWCDWIAGRFAAVDLRHMLQSGDVALDFPEKLTPGRAARLLVKAEATWGRYTYDLALIRLARVYQRTADDEERSAESRDYARESVAACDALKEWIRGLLDAVPEPDADGTVGLTPIVAAAELLVERCSACTSALDGVARQDLQEAIAELHALDRFRCSLVQALGFIRERATGLTTAPDRARPGHLHISTLPQAAFAGRPHLFIVGLEEGRVFPAASEDPVLLDDERRAISPALRLSTDRIDEAVYAVLARLATHGPSTVSTPGSLGTELTFSYSCLDTRRYRESLPSWLMLQAARLVTNDASLTYEGLKKHLGEPVSCVPGSMDRAVSDAGWWLAALKDAPDSGRPHVLSHFAHVAAGVLAQNWRASDAFTDHDGFAVDAGAALDPVANAIAVSSTTLEDVAVCPQRYFIRRGLRVEPVPDAERDRDAWLDPLTRGAELHDLYARLMRRCRKESRRPHRARDAWLLERAEERLQALARDMPPPSPEVYDREKRDFLRDVELFLEHEARWRGGEPVGFEVSFGRAYGRDDAGEEEETLARPEPVAIPLGRGRKLLLNGRIDRIERVGDSLYDVIDYKTGGFWREKWQGLFARGTRLQHALYGVAAAELMQTGDPGARIRQGVYFFTSARGGNERVAFPNFGPAKTAAVLDDLVSVISSGAFVHTTNEDDCRFCDYGRACGAGAPERARRKLENAAEARLGPFRKLASHE